MKAYRVEEMDRHSVVAGRSINANTPWVAAEMATGSEVTNARGDERRWIRVTNEADGVVNRYAFKDRR
ncbi:MULTISPECIES: hypothetical protein [unclassified Mesorhizobium]|uniref:hypothetical protein n=1 Tax=unclassified Mesorhizobium TaxID=325217 RepID=UPI000FCC227A|nr:MULTISPECIES: hypothetical protein [unclassified Mesorhizobium]RUV40909.1 hypothetical protein EOD29_26240 [Mesorhizobium sp. M1A.T.Ca.IN.004.03.1.1]RWK28015.1 MAG: hypothetical protein EOR40_29010 [Mesorhizobium sp.]RWK85204.1 MAG: hypothetical protein EOR52_28230 [Mesorhizobium sp.]TIP15292.1 MAG: hypothetical protein E5X66_30630 [Mesorhizobium sp.]TJV76815.1 MAG: hypothetical protein E5X45_29435 [Mesorhizobium sp.]